MQVRNLRQFDCVGTWAQTTARVSLLCCLLALLALPRPAYSFAIAVRDNINLNGVAITVDSFDSGNPLYSTDGMYDPAKSKSGGDIVSGGQLTDAISIGSATVNGKVRTGPTGTITIGPQGSVGEKSWTASHTGIQAGWAWNDMNVNFNSVALPDGYTNAPVVPFQTYTHNGIIYDRAIFTSGKYQSLDLYGKVYIAPGIDVGISLPNGYDQTGSEIITIGKDPITGVSGKLTLFVGGNVTVAGAGITNESGNAANFLLYGLPSATSIGLQIARPFVGVIYAPNAALMHGGSSAPYEFVGSCVVKTFTSYGHYRFHYDESLERLGMFLPVITSAPQGRFAVAGDTVAFSAAASGALNYQWQFSGTNIVDATNSTLVLTNVQWADGGIYRVWVANSRGSISAQAGLTVYPSAVATLNAPTLSTDGQQLEFGVSGAPGFNYAILVSSNLVDWEALTTNISPFQFVESNLNALPQRFYRSVWIPSP